MAPECTHQEIFIVGGTRSKAHHEISLGGAINSARHDITLGGTRNSAHQDKTHNTRWHQCNEFSIETEWSQSTSCTESTD